MTARGVVKAGLLLYLGGMGCSETNFYVDLTHRFGFGEVADEVQSLFLDGKRDEAYEAIPDELVDATSLVGTEDEVAERIEQLARGRRRPPDLLAGAHGPGAAHAHDRAPRRARRRRRAGLTGDGPLGGACRGSWSRVDDALTGRACERAGSHRVSVEGLNSLSASLGEGGAGAQATRGTEPVPRRGCPASPLGGARAQSSRSVTRPLCSARSTRATRLRFCGSVLDAELLEQRPQVGLDRVDAQVQLLGDLAVGRRARERRAVLERAAERDQHALAGPARRRRRSSASPETTVVVGARRAGPGRGPRSGRSASCRRRAGAAGR